MKYLPALYFCLSSLPSIVFSLRCSPCCPDGPPTMPVFEYEILTAFPLQRANSKQESRQYECTQCPKLSSSDCPSCQLRKDACGCCDVCAQAEGDACGYFGGGHIIGTCADYLDCDTANSTNFGWVEGVCKLKPGKETPKCGPPSLLQSANSSTASTPANCCPTKTVKESGDVFILVEYSSMKALDICVDECVYRKKGEENLFYCFANGKFNVECN